MTFFKESKKATHIFISLSFFVSILYSYLLSFTDRGLPLLDWFNVGINLFWFSILAWVAWDIHRDKSGAKGTLLFLACLVSLLTGFDLFEEDGEFLLAGVSIVEALLLFSAYLSAPILHEKKSNA
ncbi:MAG: hypothetical protein GY820_27790 [Gammaproteobacteria bacterium]|nr:hypothetical protein [Gammaproteobacteria bacterium]